MKPGLRTAPHIGQGAQLDPGYTYISLRAGYLRGYDFQSQRDAGSSTSLAFQLQNPREFTQPS